MADTGKRVGPIAGTGAAATLYTCAATNGFFIRSIHVINTTTTIQTFRMWIGAGADAAGIRIYHDEPIEPAPSPPLDWSGLLFIANTEVIQWNAPTTLTIAISGVEST